MPKVEEGVVVAGRFRLGKKLGQGGMGSVWHATQMGLDSPCAVKFLDGELGAHPEMLARFEREAKAAAALRSPHVVAIIDHALWDGVPFIAMELLDGENLGDRLARVGRLDVADTLRILGEVCRALTKAHQLGIVHRDLKPDNIFIVKDDDREITKVLDFGIAKTSGLETGSNTRTGAMLGTPYYMSPEQAQGVRAVDYRADLWSMAVIAYQCLTGKLPFESEALGDLLMKLMVAPIPVPSEVAPVPAGFDAWWMKAASRDPANRYASAKEFIDTLTEALRGATHGPAVAGMAPSIVTGPNAQTGPQVQSATGPGFGKGTQLLANTPHPEVRPMQNTPQPQMMTPAAPTETSEAHNRFAATPSPISHTFSETTSPKKNVPIALIGGIVGVVAVLAIGGIVVTRFVGGHAAAPPDGVASSVTAPHPSTVIAADPTPTMTTTATAAAAETASAASSESAPVAAPGAAAGHAAEPKGATPPAAAPSRAVTAADKPKAAASAAPAAKAAASANGARNRDFGF